MEDLKQLSAQHAPKRLWYVTDWAQRRWFDDELTARTYLLLMREAFSLRPGIDLFLGRDIPPLHVSEWKATS
jgi:hypothetical protein